MALHIFLFSCSELLQHSPSILIKICFCAFLKRQEGLSALAVGHSVMRDEVLARRNSSVAKNDRDRLICNALHFSRFFNFSFSRKRIYLHHKVGHKVVGGSYTTVRACRKTGKKHFVRAVIKDLFRVGIDQSIGNAVPPMLAKAIANAIFELIGEL